MTNRMTCGAARALSIIVLLIMLLGSASASFGQSVSRVDEISYYQYLAKNRPELLSQAEVCDTTLLFKPRYRSAIMGGSDVQTYMEDHYSTGQREEDMRWVAAQLQMEGSIQNALPSNVAVAGYSPKFYVGYTNNHPTRFTDQNGICYKVFFEFKNPTTDLTPQAYVDFVKALSNAGFVGDSKVPLAPGAIRFHYNNVIVHAVSKANALLAEQFGTRYWGAKLENTGRGVDVMHPPDNLDWHHFLCRSGGDLSSSLSRETLDYLYFR
jgi:hypothetical protein